MRKINTSRIGYVLHGRPVTKKNSMQMVKNPRTGKMFPIPSKQYKEYERMVKADLDVVPVKPIDVPVNVAVLYLLPLNKDGSIPKNPPDLTNLLEATCDLLVKYKVLADDNCTIVAGHDESKVIYKDCEPFAYVLIWTKDENNSIEIEVEDAEEGE